MNHRRDESFQPAAAVAALIFPGLGHLVLGMPRRAILIAIGVLGLFLGGLLIGGVDVVDSREDRWWFVGQAGLGPVAFGVDWLHQARLKVDDPPAGAGGNWFEGRPEPARVKSIGHVNEIGSLFATVAGMLNAICIIDAAWNTRRRDRRERRGAG